jgi:predicted dehydrogenase
MHIGVVGGGYWGSKHLRVFASMADVDQVTLVEAVDERRQSLVEAFPNIGSAAHLDEVLDDLDGVVIATKPRSHISLGLKVLRAGKHALIEKPLATSVAEAQMLCREAEANGLVLMAGHTFEFNPVVIELEKRIREGQLGQIHYLRSLRLNLGLFQSDVNVIWDLAPHDISIINFLLGETPSEVTAWGHRAAGTDFEDVAMIRLQYDRGVEAYVHVSWLDPSKVREVTVVGSERMAVYDDVKSEERLRLFDRSVEFDTGQPISPDAPMSYRYGDITSPFIDFAEPLGLENRHFVDAIRNGGASKASGRSGLEVVSVLEAAQESLRSGRAVNIASAASEVVDLRGDNPAAVS